ncbi:hypothetical protein HQ545_01095 [Candidatus Woesearchaeota archaeon]|nr:hypothetical protein [Candidatus Woesearchaeota archaeon]
MTKKLACPWRHSRKAQAESQLNWIFILIVGAVILAFFTLIVVKQRGAAEAKFAGKVSQQLNTILVGAKVASGSVQIIPTPDVSIRFTCNDYYIGPASQRLGNRVMFAPEFIEGNKLITWTLDWNVPFKSTSFLYLTSPFVRYYIVGRDVTDPAAMSLFDSVPNQLNKRLISLSDFELVRDDGDKNLRFIFVDLGRESFDIPAALEDVDLSGLIVDTEGHRVRFLVRSVDALISSGPYYTYTENEVMYGAFFSDNEEMYSCIMERAYNRLNMVSRVLLEKFNIMAPDYESTSCEGLYRDNPELSRMIIATESYHPDYSEVGSLKSELREKNQLAQLRSCPLLY